MHSVWEHCNLVSTFVRCCPLVDTIRALDITGMFLCQMHELVDLYKDKVNRTDSVRLTFVVSRTDWFIDLVPAKGGWMRSTTEDDRFRNTGLRTLQTFAARYIHRPIGTAVLHLHKAVMCRSCAQLILRCGNTAGSNRVSTSNRFSLIVLTKTGSVPLTAYA